MNMYLYMYIYIYIHVYGIIYVHIYIYTYNMCIYIDGSPDCSTRHPTSPAFVCPLMGKPANPSHFACLFEHGEYVLFGQTH